MTFHLNFFITDFSVGFCRFQEKTRLFWNLNSFVIEKQLHQSFNVLEKWDQAYFGSFFFCFRVEFEFWNHSLFQDDRIRWFIFIQNYSFRLLLSNCQWNHTDFICLSSFFRIHSCEFIMKWSYWRFCFLPYWELPWVTIVKLVRFFSILKVKWCLL